MPLTYRLLTTSVEWPADPEALAEAIRTQGPFEPRVQTDGDMLRVEDATAGLRTQARLLAYPPQAYETILGEEHYVPRMLPRDQETPRPLQRLVEITTTPIGSGADTQSQALFHATVTDGLWWLMGGLLADPYRKTLWGWRRWRGDQPLAAHAAETSAQVQAAAGSDTP